MLLEDILLAVVVGVVVLIIGLPIVRFLKAVPLRRRDPLAEAQERLRIAKLEAEAARVNREAEEIYKHLYEDTLEAAKAVPVQDHPSVAGRAGGSRVAAPDEPGEAESSDETTEKGKSHGKGMDLSLRSSSSRRGSWAESWCSSSWSGCSPER